MSNAIQNILVLVGIIMIGLVGWFMYNENQRTALDIQGGSDLQTQIASFIQTQGMLRAIDIDTSIVDDPNFRVLQTVTDEPPVLDRGRDNPFTPVN